MPRKQFSVAKENLQPLVIKSFTALDVKHEYSEDKTLWSLNTTPIAGDGSQSHGSGTVFPR